jgi:hypothetical protein
MRGSIDAIFDDVAKPTGLARVAPPVAARGAMFAARQRAGRVEPSTMAAVVPEVDYYLSG